MPCCSRMKKTRTEKTAASDESKRTSTAEGEVHWFSRWKQRQEIRKSYYAAAQSGGMAAQAAGSSKAASGSASAARSGVEQVADKGRSAVSAAVNGIANFAKGNAHALVVVGVFLLLLLLVMSAFSSCSILFSGTTHVSGQTIYTAEDRDIRGAEQDYKKLEKELDKKIKRTPQDHPGYNEYQYHLDPIEHDPWQLTSFLTTLYDDYTRSEVQGKLKEIFKKQYKLTTWVEVQIRYRTVWVISPAGIPVPTQVPYEYKIFHMKLENRGLEVVIREELTEDQWQRYQIFQDTLGGRPYLFNGGLPPGGSDGSGAPGIDYTVPAEALTDSEFASIYEEAKKYVGTPYVWGGSSPETGFDCSGYVCWVYNQNGYDVGRTTANGLWKKSQHISEAEAKPGDLVFFKGTYDTPGMSHCGIYLGNGMMVSAGDPIKYANIHSSYEAALCRERADWMVGINASRLFSCLYGRPLAVGRVMTPVLAMTVVREAEIAAFIPEKFYTVAIEFAGGGTASSRRFSQKADAEALLTSCRKEAYAVVQDAERKEKSENPPQLYDLTTLQRDANRLLGFTAQQTLNYAQSLYEKRLITYPRTDSRFLTEDMAESLLGLASGTAAIFGAEEKLLVHVQQVINGSKVTDHHALLPTASVARADLSALPAGEMSILRLIAARLLCAVGEPYRYAETVLTTICAGEEFSAKGKVVLDEGWKSIERRVLGDLLSKKKEPAALPDVQKQSRYSIAGTELKEGQTSPPKHYNEDLLLSSMQSAGADSMEDDVERTGIGTPATRAATIEKLVQKGFLERKGDRKSKILLPTEKGRALVTVMPEQIQSPEMTADWENKLLRIERGEMEPEEFMTEIKEMVSSLVNTTEAVKGANALMKNKVIGACPNCGTNVVEREKGWFCENRECRFALWKDSAYFKRLGKHLDGRVVDKLLRDGRVRLKDCKSAKGKTYNATVLLSAESDGRSKFSLEFENGGC